MSRMRNWVLGCLVLPIGVLGASTCSYGQELGKETSLRLAPKDAAYYLGNFRLQDQWEAIAEGPFAKKLMSLPVVQENLAVFKSQWQDRNGPLGQPRMVYENPNVQDAISFLKDLASQEAFIFSDGDTSDAIRLLGEVVEEMQIVAAKIEADETYLEEAIEKWVDQIKAVKIPSTVMGAKFKDEYQAVTKIDQLEALLTFGLQARPESARFARSLKRIDDDRGSRLTFEFSGKMIPWDEVPTNEEFTEEIKESIRSALDDRTLALTIGSLDNFFIFAVTEKGADVLKLGQGETLLDHPDMSPIKNADHGAVTGVGYVSDAFAVANFEVNNKNQLTRNFDSFKAQIEATEDLTPEQEEFLGDVRAECVRFDAELARLIPTSKGQTFYTTMGPTGWDMWLHNRTQNIVLDGSKPLTGVSRVGENPLLFAVTRFQNRPEGFKLLKDVVGTARKLLNRAVELNIAVGDEDDDSNEVSSKLAEVKEGVDAFWPSLEKLAKILEEKFFPACEGENGIVVSSGNLLESQWFKDMPPSDVPLPVFEVASLTKTKDNALLQEGFTELFDWIDEVLQIARGMSPDIPAEPANIPRPEALSSPKGEMYGYTLPSELGLPEGIALQGLFIDDYFIAGYSSQQVQKLAIPAKLSFGGERLSSGKPLASVSAMQLGKLLGVIKPWIRYGMMQSIEDLDYSLLDSEEPLLQDYTLTANDVLSLWSALEVLGTLSSTVTAESSGGTVTHTVYTIATP